MLLSIFFDSHLLNLKTQSLNWANNLMAEDRVQVKEAFRIELILLLDIQAIGSSILLGYNHK